MLYTLYSLQSTTQQGSLLWIAGEERPSITGHYIVTGISAIENYIASTANFHNKKTRVEKVTFSVSLYKKNLTKWNRACLLYYATINTDIKIVLPIKMYVSTVRMVLMYTVRCTMYVQEEYSDQLELVLNKKSSECFFCISMYTLYNQLDGKLFDNNFPFCQCSLATMNPLKKSSEECDGKNEKFKRNFISFPCT